MSAFGGKADLIKLTHCPFINLKGMDDGSIKVVDLNSEKVVASVGTLKNMGFNPNRIVLLPKWNHLAGH